MHPLPSRQPMWVGVADGKQASHETNRHTTGHGGHHEEGPKRRTTSCPIRHPPAATGTRHWLCAAYCWPTLS